MYSVFDRVTAQTSELADFGGLLRELCSLTSLNVMLAWSTCYSLLRLVRYYIYAFAERVIGNAIPVYAYVHLDINKRVSNEKLPGITYFGEYNLQHEITAYINLTADGYRHLNVPKICVDLQLVRSEKCQFFF